MDNKLNIIDMRSDAVIPDDIHDEFFDCANRWLNRTKSKNNKIIT